MRVDWYAHIKDEQDKADRKQKVEKFVEAWGIAKDVLQEKLKTVEKTSVSKAEYESPSWPYLQADHVGYMRALREVIELLTLE